MLTSLNYGTRCLKGLKSNGGRSLIGRRNISNSSTPPPPFYFTGDVGSFVPIHNVNWPPSLRQQPVTRLETIIDDNTSTNAVLNQIQRNNNTVLFHGHAHNIRQLYASLVKKIEVVENIQGPKASTEQPKAFHVQKQIQNHSSLILNRVLLSLGYNNFKKYDLDKLPYTSSIINAPPEPFYSVIGVQNFKSVLEAADDSMALLLDTASKIPQYELPATVSTIRGAVVGLDHYMKLKNAQNIFQHGVPVKSLGGLFVHPWPRVFGPHLSSEYIDLFMQGLDQSGILKRLPISAKVLEIGTGCGVLSFALLKRLRSLNITATDILAESISAAKHNYAKVRDQIRRNSGNARASFGNFFALQADCYPSSSAEKQKYELIYSFPAYLPSSQIHDPAEVGIYDKNSRMLKQIFFGAPAHLQDHGRLVILYPNMSEVLKLESGDIIAELAAKVNMEIEKKFETKFEDLKTEKLAFGDVSDHYRADSKLVMFIIKKKNQP